MSLNLKISHARFPYKIKYYSHEYIENDTALLPLDKVKGVFFARKISNVVKTSYVNQAGMKSIKETLTLYTEDFINNLVNDDFLIFQNKKWLITKIEQTDLSDLKQWRGYEIQIRS